MLMITSENKNTLPLLIHFWGAKTHGEKLLLHLSIN